MKKLLAICLLLAAFPARSQTFEPLWQGNMPNSKGMAVADVDDNGRMRQVGTPGYYVFKPPKEENKGAAVVICPPGGYAHLTYDIAGFQLAKWFNTMGVTAVVLFHRLPHSPDLVQREIGPLQDLQRMMKIVRARAEEWGIDPAKVGVMGCSAGGHLAASIGTTTTDYSRVGDLYDDLPWQSNFTILVSPVITLGEKAHTGSRDNLLGKNASPELIRRFSCELNVTPQTPPAFLAHANDDPAVPVENSVMFYSALHAQGVNASLHVFPYGGHNIALRNNPGSTRLWVLLCEAWLYEMGIINEKK